jgi:hypothetical protein
MYQRSWACQIHRFEHLDDFLKNNGNGEEAGHKQVYFDPGIPDAPTCQGMNLSWNGWA